MTIHEMLSGAGAELRAMELKIEALARELKTEKEDNDRLREAHAKAEAARMHAVSDLEHYRGIFVASVCIESMSICKQMFEATHENVKNRAEEAVQRMIEEKLDKEREESATKPASDLDGDNSFQPEIEQAPAKSSPVPQDGAIVQAPFGLNKIDTKRFYHRAIGQVPPNYLERPVFERIDGSWFQQKRNQGPPSFLANREPREDLRGGVSRLGLMLFGG